MNHENSLLNEVINTSFPTYFKATAIMGKFFQFYLKLPNHPFKVRIENFLGNLLFPKGICLESSSNYHQRIQLSANDYIARHLMLGEGFEPQTMKLIMHIMKDGGNFLDVGANIGLFSILVAGLPKTTVFSVDASPIAFSALLKNIELNKYSNVTAVNTALSDEPLQIVKFGCPNKANLGTSKVLSDNEGVENYFYVQTTTLKHLQNHFSNFSNIKLLKIDVEGFESFVLKGFPWNSDWKPQHIIAEAEEGHDGDNVKKMIELLEANGYKMYDVTGKPIDYYSNVIPDLNIWFQLKNN